MRKTNKQLTEENDRLKTQANTAKYDRRRSVNVIIETAEKLRIQAFLFEVGEITAPDMITRIIWLVPVDVESRKKKEKETRKSR